MKGKKILVLFLAVTLIVGTFAACGGSQPAQNSGGGEGGGQHVTLRFANLYPDASHQGIAMQYFKELVESRSENVTVELFFNGILGNEGELCESISAGTIDLVAVGSGIAVHLPNAAIMEAPFVFDSFAEANKILQDPRFVALHTLGAAENNIVPLGYNPFGYRIVFADRPVYSMADFKGLRLRVPNIPLWLEIWDALGASYVALPLSELVPALEQGVIDGQDASVNGSLTNGSYELSDYLIETDHMMAFQMWLLNSGSLGSLTPEDQQIVLKSADEAIQYSWEVVENGLKDDYAFIDEVMTIIKPDEQFKTDMRNAIVPVIDWFATTAPNGREILDLIETIKAGN